MQTLHRFVRRVVLGISVSLSIVAAPAVLVVSDAGAAAKTIPQPTLERLKKGLPVAPEKDRVDIAMPTFTNPTRITNPLFPISDLHSAVLLGNIDKRLFRSETTLIPKDKTIEWMGQKVRVIESQYMATLDGRIEEVALDWYAQADDGAVWYFGEDVFNYSDGVIEDREGTWIAGEDGPAAMIMPAKPKVGDVFRPENIPGSVFEEVRVTAVGHTADGPSRRVTGAITTEELHQDGNVSAKIFAPGYGEFLTGNDHELEALAIAVPADALAGPPPPALETLVRGSETIFDAARSKDWKKAAATLKSMQSEWRGYRSKNKVPALLDAQMNRALAALAGDALVPAVDARDAGGTMHAATFVTLAALDLQLRHRPPVEIDRARFDAWARRFQFDAGGDDPGAVAGDVTVLEWIRERITHALDAADAARIDAELKQLRVAADAEDMEKAASLAPRFRQTAAGLRLVSDRR